jgi:hypothetical protein
VVGRGAQSTGSQVRHALPHRDHAVEASAARRIGRYLTNKVDLVEDVDPSLIHSNGASGGTYCNPANSTAHAKMHPLRPLRPLKRSTAFDDGRRLWAAVADLPVRSTGDSQTMFTKEKR